MHHDRLNSLLRYDQVYDYDFKKHAGRNGKPYSAFVQEVWKNSKRVGMGRAIGKVKGQKFAFYCVRYKPNGFLGDLKNFKKNVKQGKFTGLLPFVKVKVGNGMQGRSLASRRLNIFYIVYNELYRMSSTIVYTI